MRQRSADLALYVITLQKRLLTEPVLDDALREAVEQGVSLKAYLYQAGLLDQPTLDRVLRTRAKHARSCSACHKPTYLLPGQNPSEVSCELCGAELQLPSAEKAAGLEFADEAPGAPAASASESAEATMPGSPPVSEATLPGSPPASEVTMPGAPPGRRPPPRGRRITARHRRPRRRGGPARRRPAPPPSQPAPQTPPPIPQSDTPGESKPKPQSVGPAKIDRGVGWELGYEPQEPESVPRKVDVQPPGEEDRDARAKRLRQEGGGFGYEPPEEPIERPRGRVGMPMPVGVPDDGIREASPDEEITDEGVASAAFRPPAAHVAAVAPAALEEVPPMRHQVFEILAMPLKSFESLGLISLSALFLYLLSFVPCWMYALVFLVLVYFPHAYYVKMTETAMQGRTELPDWPEFDPIDLFFGIFMGQGALFFRLIGIYLACWLPAALLWIPLMGASVLLMGLSGPPPGHLTIGEDAHSSAPSDPYVASGTPAPITAYTAKDQVPVNTGSGKWTVVGLLGRDRADETGMTELMQDMPTGGYGVVIMHAYQIYDLDRVGQACGDSVDVWALYADPAEKVIASRYPFLGLHEEWAGGGDDDYDDYDDDYDDSGFGDYDPSEEEQEALEEARRLAELGGHLNAGVGMDDPTHPSKNPFKALQIVHTNELTWPEPFKEKVRAGTIYVIDPAGKVAREYSTGVYDMKLYADLQSLMRGGDGDARPIALPAHAGGYGGGISLSGPLLVLLWLLWILVLIAGAFYWPIAWLVMVAFTSGTLPFVYPVGIRAIAVSFKDYLVLAGMLVVVMFSVLFLQFWVSLFLPGFVVDYGSYWLSFYAGVVTAYGIGRYYYANQVQIGWFAKA